MKTADQEVSRLIIKMYRDCRSNLNKTSDQNVLRELIKDQALTRLNPK